MKLSIVSSLYQSGDYVDIFVERASLVARKFSEDYEIILVNDGSTDHTLEKSIHLVETYEKLILINLSRNFGHHKALFAGLRHARGEYVFLLDSDLEEHPEWLPKLYEQLKQHNADIVYAVQSNRKGGWVERVLGALFYKLFNKATDFKIPESAMVARLMSQRFVQTLIAFPESTDFLPGLFAYSGYKQVALKFEKESKGKSSYTFWKRAELAINAFIRFSFMPLKLILITGVVITLISMVMFVCFIVKALSDNAFEGGLYLVITVILAVGGLILSALGLISLYLMRIFSEVRNRPDVIIEKVYSKSADKPDEF